MKNSIKRLLSLAVAVVMVLAMLPAGIVQVSAADGAAIDMYYDDRLPITELGGTASSAVEISGQTVTSKQVGSSAADSAVLTNVNGELIAVGVGTATVTVDGNAYAVKVSPAPITLLMITGHSIGAGQTGVAAQSVKCEAGQVYSSHGTSYASADATGVGLGYGAASRPANVDALVSGGVIGEAGGIAYRWNQLTGEKIWVLNTAVGGTSLTKWLKGETAYNNAVKVFQYAQSVLAGEIAAGHYTLQHQVVINHSCANWDYGDNGSWDVTQGKGWYDSMLNGFKADLAKDVDGDGTVDGLDGIGFVPIYTASNPASYGNDRPANFFMAASDSYPNVFMASIATKIWNQDISKFPDITYTTQGTAVSKPASAADLYATDKVHLSQVAYNAGGMDIAENLYTYLRQDNTVSSLTFKSSTGAAVADEIVMNVGESISLVPEVSPITANDLTFTLSKNLSMTWPCTITAEADGMGTLKVTQNGAEVARLTFAVGDTSVPVEPSFPEGWSVSYHCVCGNADSKNNPCAQAGHVPVEWKPWTITNTVPFQAGYWYLPNDIDLTSATDYKYGSNFSTTTGVIGRNPTVANGNSTYVGSVVNVYVDLNGKTVTGKSGHRIYRLEDDKAHTLTICDTAGGGKLVAKSSATNTNNGMGIWTRNTGSVVTIYGGTIDGSGATIYSASGTANGGTIHNCATVNIYGGKIIGGTVTGSVSQGANIYNKGTVNIYGGVIQGGTANKGTVQGGNIRNEKNLNIYGGTITGGTATGTNAQGGNVSNTGTFYMSGGTITGGTASDTDGGNGGCLFTTNGGTMEGGTITGGVCTRTGASGNNWHGGCVYIYGGSFQLKGGTIQAATSKDAVAYRGAGVYVNGSATASFTMTGGLVVAGRVIDFGGAIGTQTNGTINIQGGTVTAAFYADGTPVTDPADAMAAGVTRLSHAGAAVGTWGGTVNMTGGTIIAGDGGGAGGGAVSVHGGTKFNMSGGLITGGTGTSTNVLYGGAVSVYSSGSVFTMTGGTITGNRTTKGAVFVRNGGAMTVSGDAVITGNTTPSGAACNVLLSNAMSGSATPVHSQITVGSAGMGENAKIGVSMAVPGVFTTNAADASAFAGDSGYYVAANADGKLSLTTHSGTGHCICGGTYDGCDHAALEGEWKAWDGKSAISAGGNYYLTQSLTGSTQYWMGGSASNATAMTINLCLNGHSIDSNYRVFGIAPKVTFNLMNCHEVESVLAGCCATGDDGRVVAVNSGDATMSMYGNIKLLSKETAGRVVRNGGALKIEGVFNMYGGEVVGGYVGGMTSTTKDGTTTYTVHPGQGGVAMVGGAGRFNLYGGTLYGGNGGLYGSNKVVDGVNGKYEARSVGGVVFLFNGGQFNIYDGTVYGGNVGDGGVVYSNGANAKFNIYGGTIYAGLAQYGGGVAKLEGGATVTMTGGVIDGINPMRPRDIRNAGGAGGGAFLLWNSHGVITGDAVIRNCITENYGGAVKVATDKSTLTLGGSVQLTDNGRGNINASTTDDVYLASGAKIKLDGLTTDAKVGIRMAAPGVFATEGASQELAVVFQSNDDLFSVKYGEQGLYLGGAPVIAGTNGYKDLACAMAAVKENELVTLNADQTGDITVPVSIYLDLNSYDISGNVTVAEGAQLKLFDSATSDYTAENRGKITAITGDVARTLNTPSAYGHNYKYLTVKEADGYSAHRIYLSVKSAVLTPYKSEGGVKYTAMNYKTVFKCNDVVAQYVESYGAKLTGDNTVYVDHLAEDFTLASGAAEQNARVTALAGTMKSTNTPEQNTANASAAPKVSAYITLNDGLTAEVSSAQVTKTLKQAISEANACNTLTEEQQFRLGQMYETFKDAMDTWTDIYMGRIRICYAEKVLGEPIVADKAIALTFDDGPNLANSMEDVMAILDSYDQKATFFLIGKLIDDTTAPVVKAAYDAGHELGNHSNSHTKLTDKELDEAISDWEECQNAVEAITGEAPRFFRYPFLTYTAELLDNIGAPAINGTGAGDYNAGVTAADVAKSVITNAKDGGIILLHVSKGYDWTEEALHTVIPELRSLGYEITTVGGLFEAKGVEPLDGVAYNEVTE